MIEEQNEGQPEKSNFSDQKKIKPRKKGNIIKPLLAVIKPFDVKTMDAAQLKTKVA